MYEVVIVGGGPAGLQAALMLGRARRRVLVCDAGPPRNAAAVELHNFVTRDGTAPREFRQVAHDQLARYDAVERRTARVDAIEGEFDRFTLAVDGGPVEARRVLLCAGMVDELPALPGFRALWGHAIVTCPYCHGWEVRDRRFGALATDAAGLAHARFLQGWSRDVIAFTDGAFEVPADVRATLAAAGIAIEEAPLRQVMATADGAGLAAIELSDGRTVERDVLFARPPQHQTAVVAGLGLTLDVNGYVTVDAGGATSRAGIYAAGDLTTMMQTAIFAAAAGAGAAHAINVGLAG